VGAWREKVELAPEQPGVYLFRDQQGRVLYVGKARHLRHRLRSYLQGGGRLPPRIQVMLSHAADVELLTTDSELEALLLECNLIKKYSPRYNIMLRDDKHYPYLRVSVQEEWPRVTIARRIRDDGARYFGPYYPAQAVWETLRLVRHLFPLRICSERTLRHASRPCLHYHIKRCPAPCCRKVSREEYQRTVEDLCLFLSGRSEEIVQRLRRRMEQAAENMEFERAARLRDQLRAVERITEEQKVISERAEDLDAIGIARRGAVAAFQVFRIRRGKLVGYHHWVMEGTEEVDREELLLAGLEQYYAVCEDLPRQVLLPWEVGEAVGVLEALLSSRAGHRVAFPVPKRGRKRQLVKMAAANAAAMLEQAWAQSSRRQWEREATALREALALPRAPVRVEAFDVSNVQGKQPVGVMVVFEKGQAQPSQYRRFRLTGASPDDVGMMRQLLTRRLKYLLPEVPAPATRAAFRRTPDLLLVDGGLPQANAAANILRDLGLEGIPVVALAKRREELYLPGNPHPVALPDDSPALKFLQRVRDEAHRFAVEYHRRLRRKRALQSLLDEVEGIGPRRRKALLSRYADWRQMAKATVEELAQVPGMNTAVARRLKETLQRLAEEGEGG